MIYIRQFGTLRDQNLFLVSRTHGKKLLVFSSLYFFHKFSWRLWNVTILYTAYMHLWQMILNILKLMWQEIFSGIQSTKIHSYEPFFILKSEDKISA